jgi:flagellar basal body-associated protein FliL
MGNQVEREQLKSDLILPWIIVGMMLVMLAAYIIVCHTLGGQLQQPLSEAQRVLIRSVFYAVAIATFPLTNLIRHIQLRLNQTMPCSDVVYRNAAKSRYLVTVIVSMALIEVVGIFGLVMFVFGDGFNTLYIFTGLSGLGLFLYRPKADEYSEILKALTAQNHE